MDSPLFIYSLPLSFLLGVQNALVSLTQLSCLPLAALGAFGLLPDDTENGAVLARLFFLAGLATLAQALFSARRPLCMTPSLLFLSQSSDLLQSSQWEAYSDGDLYAMGLPLRVAEYRGKSSEVQGVMLLTSFLSCSFFGLLWYMKRRLPASTVQACLVTLSIHNIIHLLAETAPQLQIGRAVLFQLSFFLMVFFFFVRHLELPLLKVITNEDRKRKIKIFKLFAVLLTFIACILVNIHLELSHDTLLERATESQSWISFNFIPKEFNLPKLTIRSLIFLPSLVSQSIASYCCYAIIIENSDTQLTAFIMESAWNACSPALGVFLPLSVDPSTIGLAQLVKVKNTEVAVISGSLLIVMAAFVKVISLSWFPPSLLQAAVGVFLYVYLLATVLTGVKKDTDGEKMKEIVISVTTGLVLSSMSPRLDGPFYQNLLVVVIKNPVLVTFVVSLFLLLSNRIPNKYSSKNSVI